MPFIPAENTAKLVLNYNWHGHATANILHAYKDGGILPGDLHAAVMAVSDWWDEDLSAALSNDLSIANVHGLDVSVPEGDEDENTTFTSSSGDVGAPSVPNNVALVITWRSGFSGRSRRGRSFIPGIPTDQLDGTNHVTELYADGMNTIAAALIDKLSSVDWTLCVASYVHAGAPRTEALLSRILLHSVESKLDTQRRRLKDAS